MTEDAQKSPRPSAELVAKLKSCMADVWKLEIVGARNSLTKPDEEAPFFCFLKNGAPVPTEALEGWRKRKEPIPDLDISDARPATYRETLDIIAGADWDTEALLALATVRHVFPDLPDELIADDALGRLAVAWPYYRDTKPGSFLDILKEITGRGKSGWPPTVSAEDMVARWQSTSQRRKPDAVYSLATKRASEGKDDFGMLSMLTRQAWVYWAIPSTERALQFVQGVAANKHQHHLAGEVASRVFDKLKAPEEDRDPDALATALYKSVAVLAKALEALGPQPNPADMDAAFVSHLRRGKKHAERLAKGTSAAIAKRAGDRTQELRLWQHEFFGERFLTILGEALWVDQLKPELEHKNRNPPALTYAVHEDVARIHSRTHVLETRGGQRHLVFDDRDPIAMVPAMAEDALAALIERGVKLFGSLPAIMALHWEVKTGHDRVFAGVPDARVLSIDGGWKAFAHDILGLKSKGQATDLRAIVNAQAAVKFTLPSGKTGNMLALEETPAKRGRRGKVEITLGTMLVPHYGRELKEQLSGRLLSESKRLVPIGDLPPFVGRPNEHGAQATASMLVMREFRTKARQLAADGAIAIPLERWDEILCAAGVPLAQRDKLLECWTDRDGPAFLTKLDSDRYTLAEHHAQARAFIEEAGAREISGAEAGRRSVQSREAKRKRVLKLSTSTK